MIQSKTIPILTGKEIHLDPVGENVEMSIKLLTAYHTSDWTGAEKPRLIELERILLTREERLQLVAALMGLDKEKQEQKEAA
jgi:hypothetical protein